MLDQHVWVFFYGLYMDFDILRERGLRVQQWEVAKLDGYEFCIGSWGYLKQSDSQSVYGVAVYATRKEVSDLYAPATNTLPLDYFPEPVLLESAPGRLRKALCYIAINEPDTNTVNLDYFNGMVKLAQHFQFPDWYVKRLQSLGPSIQETPNSHSRTGYTCIN